MELNAIATAKWQITKTLRVMKFTAILLLATVLQIHATTHGQTVNMHVKNLPIEKFFAEIERQTGYTFSYEQRFLDEVKTLSVEVKAASIESTLTDAFKNLNFTYTVLGKVISISSKSNSDEKTDKIGMEPTFIDIKGTIVNERKEALEALTVSVKDSKKATATDSKGEFVLRGVEINSVLIITGTNIETLEYKITGLSNVWITVKTKVAGMSEITINNGYQILPKERSTGSFTQISEEQLDQRVAPDVISKLEGITNGLAFNKQIDGTNALRIRGESTIFANPTPLVVVDNFPYDGNINNLNPNDIETINILKDAAAASIWGVQAGNGVIVITTKNGRMKQPLKVELNTNISVTDKPKLNSVKNMSSTDYIDFEGFLFNQGYFDEALNDPNMPAVSEVVEILNDKLKGLISEGEALNSLLSLRKNDWKDDVLKYIYQTSAHQQYQINLSGGANKTNYYFSAGYDKDIPNLIGDKSNRITISSKANFKILKNLDFSIGLFYNNTSNENNAILPSVNPYTRLIDTEGNPKPFSQHRKSFEDSTLKHNFLDWKYYPLQERDNSSSTSKENETRFLTGLKYIIGKGLSIEALYQYQVALNDFVRYQSPASYSIRDKYNTFAIINGNNFIGSNYNNQQLNRGLLNTTNNKLIGHDGRIAINYNKIWNEHIIAAIIGFEAKQTSVESSSNILYGYDPETGSFVIPNLFTSYPTYPSLGSDVIDNPGSGLSSTGTLNRFRSYFGNASYTFKDKYSISGSARLDGSNYFGVKSNQKTVPLWSTGFKWDISREDFFNFPTLSYLSFRFTYGYNGNLAQNLAAITTIKYGSFPDTKTGLPIALVNNIPNPQLRWEKTKHINFGIDFTSKSNLVSGSLEYFYKKGNDLIGDAPIDPTTGVTQIRGNYSGMNAKGVDIQIKTKILDKNLKWNANLIFNYVADKVTKYDIKYSSYNFLLNAFRQVYPQVGSPLYPLYSYKWAGLDPSNGDPRIYLADSINKKYDGSTTGAIKLNDLSFDGRYNPPIFGSILNSFSWRRLNLKVNITYKFDYYFRRNSIDYSTLLSDWEKNGTSDYTARWQKTGDEKNTDIPSMNYPFNPTRDAFYGQSNILTEKGDHIRLQFINFNYELNGPLVKKSPFQSVQVYIYANNVGILWRANKWKIDPDYLYRGYPQSRSYSIGLKAIL